MAQITQADVEAPASVKYKTKNDKLFLWFSSKNLHIIRCFMRNSVTQNELGNEWRPCEVQNYPDSDEKLCSNKVLF